MSAFSATRSALVSNFCRTQLINFFRVNENNRFVDLPGYGFAKASKEKQKSLQIGRMGRAGTILTGGEGVTEEASVGKTILGGSSGNTY